MWNTCNAERCDLVKVHWCSFEQEEIKKKLCCEIVTRSYKHTTPVPSSRMQLNPEYTLNIPWIYPEFSDILTPGTSRLLSPLPSSSSSKQTPYSTQIRAAVRESCTSCTVRGPNCRPMPPARGHRGRSRCRHFGPTCPTCPTCLGVVDQGTHPGAAQQKSSPVVLGVHFNLRPDRASFTMDLTLKHCLRDHLALSGCFLHLFCLLRAVKICCGFGSRSRSPDRQIACKAPNELRWSWTWHRRSSHHHPNLEEWLRHANNRQVRKSVDKNKSWANDSAWCLFYYDHWSAVSFHRVLHRNFLLLLVARCYS